MSMFVGGGSYARLSSLEGVGRWRPFARASFAGGRERPAVMPGCLPLVLAFGDHSFDFAHVPHAGAPWRPAVNSSVIPGCLP